MAVFPLQYSIPVQKAMVRKGMVWYTNSRPATRIAQFNNIQQGGQQENSHLEQYVTYHGRAERPWVVLEQVVDGGCQGWEV